MGLVSLLMNLIFIVGLILITISLTKAYNTTTSHSHQTNISYTVPPSPSFISPSPSEIFNELASGSPWISNIDITRNVYDISQNPNRYGISQF
ncbi:putative orfan [Tupanvirus soda lake]|uniref:Orfan n=1 Tax=Tupanvirus deep ocean TaxID=2126984 RepID=A0AC59HBZ3_9VIRU|nr:putative orfan [Tupanvirus soda lake]AUL78175.2 putative orfan [Tupanvirus soda lake]